MKWHGFRSLGMRWRLCVIIFVAIYITGCAPGTFGQAEGNLESTSAPEATPMTEATNAQQAKEEKPPEETPPDEDASEQKSTPEPSTTTMPAETATPEETPVPDDTASPEETKTPDESEAPEETPISEVSEAPEDTAAPVDTPDTNATEPADTWEIGRNGIVKTSNTRLYAKPSGDAKKVSKLYKGDEIKVVSGTLNASGDTWYLIKSGKKKGYVQASAIVIASDVEDNSGLIKTRAKRSQKLTWKRTADVAGTAMAIPEIYQFDYRTTLCYYDGIPRSVSRSGCGVTCLSMVIVYLTGNVNQTPETLFDWALDNSLYYGNGLGHEQMRKVAAQWGVKGKWISNDAEKVEAALRQGYPVIAHMGEGLFTSEGHYIVLLGVTEDGEILVNDPNDKSHSGRSYSMDLILDEVRSNDMSFMVCYPISGAQEN